jgi:hypothetical protein
MIIEYTRWFLSSVAWAFCVDTQELLDYWISHLVLSTRLFKLDTIINLERSDNQRDSKLRSECMLRVYHVLLNDGKLQKFYINYRLLFAFLKTKTSLIYALSGQKKSWFIKYISKMLLKFVSHLLAVWLLGPHLSFISRPLFAIIRQKHYQCMY